MGCDIHGVVEVKKEYGGWRYAVNPKIFLDRNYIMFGLFFGVRNYYDFLPLFAFRGLPSNIDFLTKGEFYGSDYYDEDFDMETVDLDTVDHHSVTYVSLDELNSLPEKIAYIKYNRKGETERYFHDNLNLAYNNILDEHDMKVIKECKILGKIVDGKIYEFKLDYVKFADIEYKGQRDNFKGMRELIKLMNYLKESFKEVRLIVWFDN